jgi:hypothetical protein
MYADCPRESRAANGGWSKVQTRRAMAEVLYCVHCMSAGTEAASKSEQGAVCSVQCGCAGY